LVTHELDESEFRAIFENALDGVILGSPEGEVLAANPAACHLLQRSEEDICLVGRRGITRSDDRMEMALEERDRTGSTRTEVTMVRGDGSTFIAELTSRLFTKADGTRRACIVFRDVTETMDLIERQAELVGELYFKSAGGRISQN
jgi:PAS domain S-box-containing protein